jgi:DNA-binding beta-propeller fold protein YncE
MNPRPWSVALALSFAATLPLSAQHSLVKKWETEATLKTPESVLFDAGGKVLYVSNIDGQQPWAKDNAGSIAKVGLDGKVIAAEWVKGLQAPKGMGLHNGKLYAADLDQVVVIDIAKGAIEKSIAVAGAQRLNDITIDKAGTVYVSDSGTKQVFMVKDGKASLHLDALKGPNGVLSHNGTLYVLDNGTLFKVGADKALTKLVEGMEGNTDGIEHVTGDEFVVSCWAGVMYYVNAAKGEKQLLQDTRAAKVNSADIGYDAKNRIVYVPTFFLNTVVAYELK